MNATLFRSRMRERIGMPTTTTISLDKPVLDKALCDRAFEYCKQDQRRIDWVLMRTKQYADGPGANWTWLECEQAACLDVVKHMESQ